MVSRAQAKKLIVWWNRGYYKEEDEAMLKIAEDFRKAKNVDLDISFTIQEDLPQEDHQRADGPARAPTSPSASTTTGRSSPSTRWEGQLVETTDVINELKPRYIEKFLPGRPLLRQRGQEARVLRRPHRGPDHAHPLLEGSGEGGGSEPTTPPRSP